MAIEEGPLDARTVELTPQPTVAWESYGDDLEEVDDSSKLRTEVVWPLG